MAPMSSGTLDVAVATAAPAGRVVRPDEKVTAGFVRPSPSDGAAFAAARIAESSCAFTPASGRDRSGSDGSVAARSGAVFAGVRDVGSDAGGGEVRSVTAVGAGAPRFGSAAAGAPIVATLPAAESCTGAATGKAGCDAFGWSPKLSLCADEPLPITKIARAAAATPAAMIGTGRLRTKATAEPAVLAR